MKNYNLHNNLKSILEKKNISQVQLAKGIGSTEVSVSRYINNKRVPDAIILSKMAEFLDVTIDELVWE